MEIASDLVNSQKRTVRGIEHPRTFVHYYEISTYCMNKYREGGGADVSDALLRLKCLVI